MLDSKSIRKGVENWGKFFYGACLAILFFTMIGLVMMLPLKFLIYIWHLF